ncbi:lupus La protein homolog [Mytilus galloprovincialis]|uniref:lupus La protein homolog n=1 Tax=Mytilus galloprovincialis TaxID=29158 RepID=UPI003F7B4BE2
MADTENSPPADDVDMKAGGDAETNNKSPNGEVKVEIKDEPEPEPEVLGPPNGLEKKIIKQMEYYFGDVNLPRDRYLQEQIKLDNDGWVALAVFTRFNRLKVLTTNHNIIAKAIRKASSGLISISKDGVFVRRNPDMAVPENTEEWREDFNARTAYVKGFPLKVSLDKLIIFFDKLGAGDVDTVFMRRNPNREFKGSVYVTFHTTEGMEKFMNLGEIKYEDKVLEKKTKMDYFKEKEEEKKKKKLEQLRKKKEEQKKREEEERQRVIDAMQVGSVLCVENITAIDTEREAIKNYFTDFAPVAWVDFDTGDTKACVRFEEAGKAEDVLEKAKAANEDKIVINNCELEVRVLEGEEEIVHWRKILRDQDEKKKKSSSKRKGRDHRDRGPRSKRSRDDNNDDNDKSGGDDDHDDDDDDGDE